MKKFAVMVCVIAFVIGIAGCAWGGVSLSAFPDPVFREYLKGYDSGWAEYDSNGNVIRVLQEILYTSGKITVFWMTKR